MPYLYVLAAVLLRLLPHPWNASPLDAMFLFSGATIRSKRNSLIVPFTALILSSFAVTRFLWGSGYNWFQPYTWMAYLFIALIGWAIGSKITLTRVAAGTLASSLTFFLVSNFGAWAADKLYPPTWAGLVQCYVAALPFYRGTLLGDLAYSALMFGSYEWLRHRRALATAAAQ